VRPREIAGTTGGEDLGPQAGRGDRAGTSLDNVAGIVAKLGKSIGEAQLGDEGKKSLFKALGIDPNDGRDAADRHARRGPGLAKMTDQNVAA
jgi:hypothetical protein